MAWRVANSLNQLRDQMNHLWPTRIKVSDGTIGDSLHSATSDHAARDFPGWGNDIVTARDITHDPAHGADMNKLAESIRASRDGRVKYVIWQQRMFSSYATSQYPAWAWRPYSGAYHSHLHVSVVGDSRADNTSVPWRMPYTPSTDGEPMSLTQQQATELQRIDERVGTILGNLETAPSLREPNRLGALLRAIQAKVSEPHPSAEVDVEGLAANLAGDATFVNAIADAIVARMASAEEIADAVVEEIAS